MLYHYTIAARIRAILDSGMLVPHREAGCGPGTPPLLWLSPDPHWEGGSAPYARGRLLSFHEMLRQHGPLWRILLHNSADFLTLAQFAEREPHFARAIQSVFGATALRRLLTSCQWRVTAG